MQELGDFLCVYFYFLCKN